MKSGFPILFLRGVLKATLITLCFIPTNDLEINKNWFCCWTWYYSSAWLYY